MNNYLPILAAAAVHMGVQCTWYSDHAFGKTWKKLGGCKINLKKDLQKKFGLQAVFSILTATALMIAINIFQQYQMVGVAQSGFSQIFSWFLDGAQEGASMMNAMKTAAFFWLGFSMPTMGTMMIWCDTHLHKFFIDAGCELVALACMAVTLGYLV
jgi:hypothetical protein